MTLDQLKNHLNEKFQNQASFKFEHFDTFSKDAKTFLFVNYNEIGASYDEYEIVFDKTSKIQYQVTNILTDYTEYYLKNCVTENLKHIDIINYIRNILKLEHF